MKCAFHPGAKAILCCDHCNTALCGICTNYEDDSKLCDPCLKKHSFAKTMSRSRDPVRPAVARSGQSGAMSSLLAEGKIQDEARRAEDARKAKRTEEEKPTDKILMTIVVLCSLFIAYRIVYSIESAAPLTQGEIAMEERSRASLENCMLIFWEIAEVLQENRVPSASLQCPEAGGPMIITRLEDDVIIRHPRPELHQLSDIVVSRNNPVPELIE